MQRSKIDIWVGLFVLLGAAALLFLSLKAANLVTLGSGSKGYQLVAQFQDIGGLKPQAAVRSSGVLVGRVQSIAFDDKTFQARVTLDMDSQYKFPNDSSLKILTSGLLGDQYIGIEAGYADTSWKQGDAVSNTQSAVVLENLIGQFINSKAQEAGTPAGAPADSAGGGSGDDAAPVSAPAAANSGAKAAAGARP